MEEQSNEEDWDGLGSPLTDTFNWELAKLWLRTCEQEHGEECARQIQPAEAIDILLVDTLGRCLTKATSASRYVALSYVWGQVQQFQTTTAALSDLLQPNGASGNETAPCDPRRHHNGPVHGRALSLSRRAVHPAG